MSSVQYVTIPSALDHYQVQVQLLNLSVAAEMLTRLLAAASYRRVSMFFATADPVMDHICSLDHQESPLCSWRGRSPGNSFLWDCGQTGGYILCQDEEG